MILEMKPNLSGMSGVVSKIRAGDKPALSKIF
jgi:hypothetical protein